MNIGLLGYGKMGKMVEQAAHAAGHTIVFKADSKKTTGNAESADILIDFSLPQQVLTNITMASNLKKSIVVGTTGWYENLPQAQKLVTNANIGMIYAPNFALGVALFFHIVSQAAAAIAPFPLYDVSGLEIHHKSKLDAPSGTAKKLSEILKKQLPNITHPLDFASVRVGSAPGTHTVIFDSPADCITLSHNSRSRESFATGAIQAAEWLKGKKGFFTLDDMLNLGTK